MYVYTSSVFIYTVIHTGQLVGKNECMERQPTFSKLCCRLMNPCGCFLVFRPAIRRIASENKFLEIQKQHQNEVFFLYMGPEIKEVELFVSISLVYSL